MGAKAYAHNVELDEYRRIERSMVTNEPKGRRMGCRLRDYGDTIDPHTFKPLAAAHSVSSLSCFSQPHLAYALQTPGMR